MAVRLGRAFVVVTDKVETFKNSTISPEESAFVRELAEVFRKNNLVEEGSI